MIVYIEYQNVENDSLDHIRWVLSPEYTNTFIAQYGSCYGEKPLRLNKKEYAKFLLTWKGELERW